MTQPSPERALPPQGQIAHAISEVRRQTDTMSFRLLGSASRRDFVPLDIIHPDPIDNPVDESDLELSDSSLRDMTLKQLRIVEEIGRANNEQMRSLMKWIELQKNQPDSITELDDMIMNYLSQRLLWQVADADFPDVEYVGMMWNNCGDTPNLGIPLIVAGGSKNVDFAYGLDHDGIIYPLPGFGDLATDRDTYLAVANYMNAAAHEARQIATEFTDPIQLAYEVIQ